MQKCHAQRSEGVPLPSLIHSLSHINSVAKKQGRQQQTRCSTKSGSKSFTHHSPNLTLTIALSRKEVFQPHLPVRLPCYDLAPITGFTLGRPSRSRTSGAPGFHGLTGGVYKARERIHRAMADARLLANPASWGSGCRPQSELRTALKIGATLRAPGSLYRPL